MMEFCFKNIIFLLLLLEFAVYGITAAAAAAEKEICKNLPKNEEVLIGPKMDSYSLHWQLQNISVPMLRICMQLKGQENYENGLCPTDYMPLLTIKSGQRPIFLGNNSHQCYAFKRLQFSGNLSTGELSFTMNVTDDEDSHYTFLPLVKLPGDFIARCHRNLTRYQLVVKGHDKSSSTTPGTISTKHVVPEQMTTQSPSTNASDSLAPKKDNTNHGIIAAAVIGAFIFEVLLLVVIGMRCRQHREEVQIQDVPAAQCNLNGKSV